MLHNPLVALQSAALIHPKKILVLSTTLVVLGLWMGSGVELRTSRTDLAPPDDPDQLRLMEMTGELVGFSALIACVEPADGSPLKQTALREAADRLAEEFQRDSMVARVFHKIDLEWLMEHGLYLIPPESIRTAAAAIDPESGIASLLASTESATELNETLAQELEARLAGSEQVLSHQPSASLGNLVALLRAERRFLEDPEGMTGGLEMTPALLTLAGPHPGLTGGGYLSSRDGSTLFLLIIPRDDDDSLPTLRRFVDAVRKRANTVLVERPGIRVAFTGRPATTVEEMETVRRDTWFTAFVAVLGVTVLTLFVFRWKSHAILLLVALGVGITWAFGAVRLEYGYLNLITSAFISTLVGVGIDYGIHPISEYELQGAHTIDPLAAIRRAYRWTGSAVTVSAVTTAVAFFAIMLMEFQGFAELGLVAGVGVLMCLISALVTLPALLAIFGSWRHARDRADRREPPTAPLDRIWDRHGAGFVCRFPKTVTLVALVVTVVLAWSARQVSFDTNLLNLLPEDAESLRYQRRMVLDSDLSPNFNVAWAGDMEELRTMRARAAREPTIERFESALQFVPRDVDRSREVLEELASSLERVHLPEKLRPVSREKLTRSLQRLEKALDRTSEAAFGAGMGDLAGPLEAARLETERALAHVRTAPQNAEALWSRGEARVLRWARGALADLKRASRAEPATLEDLPGDLRQRFWTRDGRLLAFLYPAGDIFDPGFLEEFIAACRRVSPETAGFPVVFRNMSSRITSGFYKTVVVGGILVFLILVVDYRNLRDTGLAILPLLIGMIWMIGGMGLLGLRFNFANVVVVPLIIGVGIDFGVHMIHRLRSEGEKGMTVVLRHTGRAVLIAGLPR